jgi:hypothetical protein
VRVDLRPLLLLLALLLVACTRVHEPNHPCPPFAAVEVLVGQGGEASLSVRRTHEVVRSFEHMFLQPGDTLTTDANTSALISFAGGRVVVKPSTSITIGVPAPEPARTRASAANGRGSALVLARPSQDSSPFRKAKAESGSGAPAPGPGAATQGPANGPPRADDEEEDDGVVPWIFAAFGELLGIGKIGVKTTSATGAVRGTKYRLLVDRSTGVSTFTVLEGRVAVTGTQATWPTLTVKAGQQVAVAQGRTQQPIALAIPKLELDQLIAESQTFGKPDEVELPSLIGLDVNEAGARLLAIGLTDPRIELVPYAGTPSSKLQVGQVVAQEPAPGQRGSYVRLQLAGVPDLTGLSATEAAKVLKHVGLELEGQSPGTKAAAARVVAQMPEAGTHATRGSAVKLVLVTALAGPDSQAGANPVLRVPDVTAVELPRAVTALQEAGFEVAVTFQRRDEVKRSRVLSQQPLPNSELPAKSSVRLLAIAPAPGATSSADPGDAAEIEVPPAFELLDEALTLGEQAQWREATHKLEKARQRAEYPNLWFHSAVAHAHLMQWDEARHSKERFEQLADPHNPLRADLLALADLTMPFAAATAATPLDAVESRRTFKVPLGPVVTIAAGATALIAGGIMFRFAANEYHTLEANCAGSSCPSGLAANQERGGRQEYVSWALFSLAGAAMLAGATWWLLMPRERQTRVSAHCGPRGCVTEARVRF